MLLPVAGLGNVPKVECEAQKNEEDFKRKKDLLGSHGLCEAGGKFLNPSDYSRLNFFRQTSHACQIPHLTKKARRRSEGYSQNLWKKLWKLCRWQVQVPVIIEKLANCTGIGHLTSNYKQDAYDCFYDFLEFFALLPANPHLI